MPTPLRVKQLRAESAGFQLDRQSTTTLVKVNWETSWEVVYDPDDVTDPSDLNAVIAGAESGLPIVGGSIFYDESSNLILPYVVASNKNVQRDEQNAYRFLVSVSYEQAEGGGQSNTPIAPPADAEDIATGITWSVRDHSVTSWSEDDTVTLPAAKKCLLPTGSLYANQTTKDTGMLVAKVVQYENTFTLAKVKERLKACNENTWESYIKYGAKIEHIQWRTVTVPIAGPSTMTSYLVEYTVACKEYKIKHLKDDGNVEDKTIGWEEPRIRADAYFNTAADDPTSRSIAVPKTPGDAMELYLKSTGIPHVKANQAGIPPYDFLRLQPIIDFDDFLRN